MLVRLIELLKSLNIVAIENNLKVYLGHHLDQNRLFRENFKNLNSEDPFYIISQKLELLDNFVKNFHDIVVRQDVKSNIIFNRVSVELKNKRIEALQDSGVLFLELLNIIDTLTLDYSKKISKLVYATDAIHSIQGEAKKDIITLDKTIHRRFIKNKKPINKKMLLFLLQKAKKASTKDAVVLKESLCLLNNYQQILSQLCLLGDFIANFVLYINSQLHRNKVLNFEEAPRRLLFLKTRMPHKDFVPRTHLMAARLLFYVERAKFANILPRDHGLRLFFKSLVFTKELSLAFSFTDSMKITKDLQQEVGYLQSVLDFDDNIAYKKKKKQFNVKHKRGYWAGLLRTINNLNNLNSTVVNVNEKLLSTLKDELKAEL